jgi:hypothetical protein
VEKMSCGLAIQTKRYGAISMFELSYGGLPVASLIREDTAVVDYSRCRVFPDLETAIEFYLGTTAQESTLASSPSGMCEQRMTL